MIRSRQFRFKFGTFCFFVLLLYINLLSGEDNDDKSNHREQQQHLPRTRKESTNKTQLNVSMTVSSMKNYSLYDCSNPKLKDDHDVINAKEFFVFKKSGVVWCNVFKSASTSVLYIMGLLEGLSDRDLRRMSRHPLVSEMRKIYGRPSPEVLQEAISQPNVKTFLVKRHPFERLFSGFKDKILRAIRGSYHDKVSQLILNTYRGLPKRMYRHKKTVPTFAEFVEYILDTYASKNEIDMHWAPVVDFCSVCKVNYTHIVDFDSLNQGLKEMLPETKSFLAKAKQKTIKLNANIKSPITKEYMRENLATLGPGLYERLCALYAKDFEVFGYHYPPFSEFSELHSKVTVVPFSVT